VGQLLAKLLRFGLRPEPIGDVHAGADVAGEATLRVVAWHAVVRDEAILAVVTAKPILQHERPAGIERLDVALEAPLEVAGVHTVGPAVAYLLLGRPPGEVQPGFVEEGAEPIHARHPDEHRQGIRHDAKARLALPQCAIGASPLRERDAEQEDQSRLQQHDGEREQEQSERQPTVACHPPQGSTEAPALT
jgi:hypothetical protein